MISVLPARFHLLGGAVVLDVGNNHLFQGVIGNATQGNQATIDSEGGGLVDAEIFGELDTRFNRGLGLGGLGALFNLFGSLTCLGGGTIEGECCTLLAGETGLAFIDGGGIQEEGWAATELGNADTVSCRPEGLRVNLHQRVALVDDVRIREVGSDFIHCGLSVFAMRALEVGELDEFQVFAGPAARWAICTLEQNGAIFGIRMCAEGENFTPGNDMFSVGEGEELERTDLLVPFFADQNYNISDAWNGCLHNPLDLVDPFRIIAP